MKLKDHTHGVVAFDCDHPDCVIAVRRCVKASAVRRLRGESAYLDATPVRHHIAALLGNDWSLRAIAGEAGVTVNVVRLIGNGTQRWAIPANAAGILSVDPNQLPTRTQGRGEPFVSRTGTVRRLQALMAIGYSHSDLHRHGIQSRTLIHQQGRWVLRSTHDKVAALYRELSRKPGPTPRAAREAAKRGYPSPAAWNDIDRDPAPDLTDELLDAAAIDEVVVLRVLAGDSVPTTTAERREIVRRWPETGRSLNELARLTGWKPERYTSRTEEAA
ncbi:hypothetical protein HZF07_00360 [Nocardioides sp. CGMCC 1.13656]|uniref:hypothetical protein n=1 Tax=Nocardioides TaxID=1839 RepID=UPI0012FCEFC4|nr:MULTISPECIES: hypothetical protein [unclassified Nocardioides]MBA2952143.1 hypothetical protein [Nocardioides sp. CGMCC 1.13656]